MTISKTTSVVNPRQGEIDWLSMAEPVYAQTEVPMVVYPQSRLRPLPRYTMTTEEEYGI